MPLGRKMGMGWDIGSAALFLASDEARFVTGDRPRGRRGIQRPGGLSRGVGSLKGDTDHDQDGVLLKRGPGCHTRSCAPLAGGARPGCGTSWGPGTLGDPLQKRNATRYDGLAELWYGDAATGRAVHKDQPADVAGDGFVALTGDFARLDCVEHVVVDGPRPEGAVKMVYPVAFRPGVDHDEARAYWLDVHAPLVAASVEATAGRPPLRGHPAGRFESGSVGRVRRAVVRLARRRPGPGAGAPARRLRPLQPSCRPPCWAASTLIIP